MIGRKVFFYLFGHICCLCVSSTLEEKHLMCCIWLTLRGIANILVANRSSDSDQDSFTSPGTFVRVGSFSRAVYISSNDLICKLLHLTFHYIS